MISSYIHRPPMMGRSTAVNNDDDDPLCLKRKKKKKKKTIKCFDFCIRHAVGIVSGRLFKGPLSSVGC